MNFFEYQVSTSKKELKDITSHVREAVKKSGIHDGLCIVFCPHTTAGVTINENADPTVVADMLFGMQCISPDHTEYVHSEGNSAAHLLSSCVGSSLNLIIDQGKLLLGTWQGIYFCEFDGPRNRKFWVKIVG